jgi:crotonobetainyl-CoA:carnitine CoA-transferase CaiB-like acyl-CoA transferase
VAGNPQWTQDPRFADPALRHKNHDDLDQIISAWTRQHDHYEIMHMLQDVGVPAGAVLDQRDATNDAHVQERGFLQEVFQEDCGTHWYPGAPFRMSETPPHIRRGPVRLGEDNEYVYKHILEVSDEEYAALEAEGHIGMDYAPGVP